MAEVLLPIGAQPLLTQGQNLGAEVTVVPVGENQEPAVVGNQCQSVIVILMMKIPADPLIAHGTLPGSRRKGQQRDPLILIGGHVPQGLTNLG